MRLIRTLIVCSFLFCFFSSHAGGIDFVSDKSWKEVLALAKKENKLIFLDAYASWCGPCKYMQSDVFTDVAVAYYYNKNFINVKMDMEKGEGVKLAEELGITSYPTLYFINGDGKVLHKRIGAMEPPDFLQLGEEAINPARQFYSIREQALTGDIEAETFHHWIHEASELEEEVDSVIISYLSKTKNPVMEKEMLLTMLDHAPLNKDQIELLFKNKETCIKLTGRTPDEFNSSMVSRVTVYATNESLMGEEFDFVKFQKIVQTYYPAEAALITKKVKIRYYNYLDQYSKSLDELAECITSPALKLKVEDLSTLITQNIKTITAEARMDEFIKKITAYKLLPADATKAYHKNLSLLVLYYCKDDKVNMKAYSDRILKDAHAPEKIKTKVKEIMEDGAGG